MIEYLLRLFGPKAGAGAGSDKDGGHAHGGSNEGRPALRQPTRRAQSTHLEPAAQCGL